MKPQLIRTKKHPSVTKPTGAESSLSLQEELVAAIHGAFEVAVEMAVQEVMKLVGQATGGVYEEMRQENESLKQRLRRAEVMLKSARMEQRGGSSPPTKQHPEATACTDQPHHHKCNRKSPDPKVEKVHDFTGRRGDTRPSDQPPDPQQKRRNQEQRSANDLKALLVSEAASDPETNNGCAGACDALTTEVNEEVSPVCVVRVESVTRPCHDDNLPPLPSEDDKSTVVQVTVKQEKPEEDSDGSASCLDSLKEEHFNSDCLLAVQSEMLVEWKPDALDIQSQDSVSPLPYTRLAQAHPPNLITNLSPPTDLQSLSSELPEAPPQVSGDNLRTSRNLGQTYTCKYCGQTFQLPSLLRRHYSQCQQKCYQQPVAGSRRTKLQLYPPGCSPFRCAVCNREFNRMENLKTHLRIHTGERPYTCTVCSKCFRHSGALTRHFRIHTGEKPYICGQCGKSFRNCGGLKFHQRSHSLQL